MPNPRLYLLDASGLCYRAYYAVSGLSTSYGQPTGAVFAFTNILNKILKEKPEYIACCFDVSRDTLRRERYKEYKSHRPAMPDELKDQMQLIRQVISSYNITISEMEGYEADDLIASFAKKAKEKDFDVLIVSSDKDILQLVNGKVAVFDPKKEKTGLLYDEEQVRLKYGVAPSHLADVFSLMGDRTDNIPGVPGVGEKTALSLIKEFGSISGLLGNIERVRPASLKEAISGNIENIRLSYDLFRLEEDIEVDFNPEKLRRKEPDYEGLYGIFRKLEFNSLLKGLPYSKDEAVLQRGGCLPLEDSANKGKVLALARTGTELFFAIDDKPQPRVYFSFPQVYPQVYSLSLADKSLAEIFAFSGLRKSSHNLKEARIILARNNIVINGPYFDTLLAAYIVDSSLPGFGLEELTYRYLGHRCAQAGLGPEESLDAIIKLIPPLESKMEENSQAGLFYNTEIPLSGVLADMHLKGVRLDAGILKKLSGELEERLITLISEIYSLNSGEEFNLNSPRQLAHVLFEKLKLPVVKKTKTGFSTDEEVLRKLSGKHKIALLLLEYRQLTKLKSTYVDALPQLVDPRTGRLHATFDQAGTETGRLSSNNPNLQNIPAKGDIAAVIRRAFIAGEGNFLVSADYSQVELRVLAHFCADEALVDAFKSGRDIHCHSASLIFQVEESLVSEQMRETAKRINFGIIYGMGSFGLAKDLGIPQGEAQNFIDSYFLRYPGVKKFIEAQINSARQSGYVTTLLGRRRHLPAINSQNGSLRSFAERQAVNSTIQGSAADLIKLAMINIYNESGLKGFNSGMIMQIHDELVFEVPAAELDDMLCLIRDKMENAYELAVPLKVNIKQGRNWQDMKLVHR